MEAPLVKQLQAAAGLQATLADHLVLRGARNRQSYRRYLERALGVERGLEAVMANFTFDWDVSSRSKLALIGGDLLALGATVEEILALPTCAATQSIRDPIEAHCWLFAVERVSTAHWAAYHQLDHVVREIASSYLCSLLSRRGWEHVCEAFGRMSADAQVVELLSATIEQAMRSHYAWFAAAEDDDDLKPTTERRFPRGSENLQQPLDRDAVAIVPSTKRIDIAAEVSTLPRPGRRAPSEEPGEGSE